MLHGAHTRHTFLIPFLAFWLRSSVACKTGKTDSVCHIQCVWFTWKRRCVKYFVVGVFFQPCNGATRQASILFISFKIDARNRLCTIFHGCQQHCARTKLLSGATSSVVHEQSWLYMSKSVARNNILSGAWAVMVVYVQKCWAEQYPQWCVSSNGHNDPRLRSHVLQMSNQVKVAHTHTHTHTHKHTHTHIHTHTHTHEW